MINIHQAKTQLSKLLEEVSLGKEIIIAKAGKPVARLTAFKEEIKPRHPGLWKNKIWISDDFNEENKAINKLFYGE